MNMKIIAPSLLKLHARKDVSTKLHSKSLHLTQKYDKKGSLEKVKQNNQRKKIKYQTRDTEIKK